MCNAREDKDFSIWQLWQGGNGLCFTTVLNFSNLSMYLGHLLLNLLDICLIYNLVYSFKLDHGI